MQLQKGVTPIQTWARQHSAQRDTCLNKVKPLSSQNQDPGTHSPELGAAKATEKPPLQRPRETLEAGTRMQKRIKFNLH